MGIYDQFYYHPTKTIEALSETPSDHIDIDALLSNLPPFVNNVDVTYKAKRTLVVHGFDLKKWNHHQITLLSTRLHNLIRAGFTVLHFHSGNIKPIDPTQIAVYMGNSKFWDGSPAPDRHLLATLCNIPVDALCLLNEADMMEMLQGDRSDWENDVGLKQIKYEIRAINVDGLNQLLLASADTLETLTLDNHMLRNTALAENIHLPHLTELHMKSTCGGYYNLQHKDVIALLKSAPNVRVLSLPSLPDLSGTPDRNSPNSIDLDRAVLYAIQKPELMTQFVLDNFDNYSHSLELLLAKMQQLKVLKLNYVEFKTTSVIPGIHGLEHLSLTNVNISTKQLGHLLSQSPNLKSLVIAHNTKLTDPITDSLRFAELEELELQSVHFNVHSLLKIINKSKTLKRLKLEYCSFTGNAQALSVNMTGLEELSLINCDNVELWLPQILSQATQLKKIVVNRCYKQDPSITTSQPFAQLEILNVSETAMTLPTLQQLLKGAHLLKVIHLNECDLDALLPLIQAPNLTVFVAAAGKINPHNLAELKLRSKNLNLLRILKCSQIAYDHRASFPIPAIEQISIEASDLTINGLLDVLERVPCKKLAIHHGGFIYDSKPVPETTLAITELDVHTVRFSPGSLEQLLQHTGNIKKLRLHDCIGNFQLSTKTRLDLANLTVLELYAVNMNRTSLLYLAEQSPKLQELIINSCDQFSLQFLSFLNVPTVIFSDGEKTITIGSTRNDSVEMDANTHKYPNQVQRVKRLFIGNPKTPAPRDVRIDCYTTATLNPNSRGDADPFILENSGDLQLEEIPDIDTARKKTPLYDAFQKAGPHHYLGRFPMEITHTWQAFPSLFPDEKLTQFYVATGQQVEIQRSKRNDFCYIRLHKNAAPLTEPVNVEILLSRAPPKFTYDSLPEFIKALAIFCRGFRDQDLTNVPADATAQTFLNAMISSRNGACRHRSFVFKYLMHQQHAQIPIRLMTNGIHMFPEVYYHNTWIRCDLGGYASTVIIDEHTFPEAPQTEESQSEEPQELFEFTMSPNGKKFIDASYFQTARNVSTITLKDYTSFDSLFGLQNLSIIETLNIRQSSIDAAGLHRLLALTYNIKTLNLSNCTIPEIEFNQLDFSILSKLEFVSITGHSVPNTAALQRLIQTAPANVQTVTDSDCQNESGTSISNITVIEKPRRIPSRYFQNTTHTQTSLYIASHVTANCLTGLIDTNSVEQLRLAQQQ